METDVLILGGGPAGLAAAYEVASRGHKVTIVDEAWALGGQLRQQTQVIDPLLEPFTGLRGFQLAEALVARLKEFPVEYLLKHEFIGLYADGSAGVNSGEEIIKITPKCIIVATGAAESANPFPGWTLPGVMTIGAAQILMNRERIYPGKTALVIGSSDMALEVAQQMHDVGIDVLGVVEPADQILATDEKIISSFTETGIPVLLRTEVESVAGSGKVEKVLLKSAIRTSDLGHRTLIFAVEENAIGTAPSEDKNISIFEVDLVCIDGGRHPILEPLSIFNCQLRYERELGGWLPCYDGSFQSSVSGVFVAGQAAGVTCQAGVVLTGAIAGISAVDLLEQVTSEEREILKEAYWHELERIESAHLPAVWRARMSHLG